MYPRLGAEEDSNLETPGGTGQKTTLTKACSLQQKDQERSTNDFFASEHYIQEAIILTSLGLQLGFLQDLFHKW